MLFAIAVILLLILDQGLKYWVTLSIPLDEGVRALIPGVLELRNIHNNGAAFSLLTGAPRWIFILLAVAFVVIIIVAVRREWVRGAFGRWMAILLLAGALGNCLDRMLSGYVVDMLAFQFWPSFPVFNVADVCLVIGAIGLFFHLILYREPEETPKQKKAAETKPHPARVESKTRRVKVDQDRPAKPAAVPTEEKTRRVEMKPRAEHAKQPEKPKAVPIVKPSEKPKAAESAAKAEADPFAAWDSALQNLEQEAKAKAAAKAAPEPIPEPKPSNVKPTVERPKKTESESYSLEDILSEFKD